MKNAILALSIVASSLAFAVPVEVEKVADKMLADGVEIRAGRTERLGVFVVASASVDIAGSAAKARNAARALAQRNLAGFLNTRIQSKESVGTQYVSDGDASQVQEFFSSLTETSVKELLKGVQDLRSFEKDGALVFVVYMTARGCDKSDEFRRAKDAMGDAGTVEAVGEAANRDAALQKALRNAVEQVLGTIVVGETAVKDLERVKSRIFAGAQGLVDEYRVTAEVQVELGVRVTVLAKVSKKKLLDSYSVYMKALGDPVFYLHTDSEELSTQFTQFFTDMGFKVSAVEAGANYRIEAAGNFREVKHPASGRKGTQLSLSVKVYAIDGSEVLVSVANDPRKSASFVGSLDRQREIVAEKAFNQMKGPVHEKIQQMVAKMMERHTDALMNADE